MDNKRDSYEWPLFDPSRVYHSGDLVDVNGVKMMVWYDTEGLSKTPNEALRDFVNGLGKLHNNKSAKLDVGDKFMHNGEEMVVTGIVNPDTVIFENKEGKVFKEVTLYPNSEASKFIEGQKAKLDAGKPKLSLAPIEQVWRAIARVREYGIKKYHDPDNWKKVEVDRYWDALYRHLAATVTDRNSVDSESGIRHIEHALCNIAFILELEKEDEE